MLFSYELERDTKIKNLEFKRWSDFQEFVNEDRQACPVYWRGQRDPSWVLSSEFERKILNLNGGWQEGTAKIYPYDNRYHREGKPIWAKGFYTDQRDPI